MTTSELCTRLGEASVALAHIRLKRGVDYAYTVKYGQVHVVCDAIWEQPVRRVFDQHGVQINTLHTYD